MKPKFFSAEKVSEIYLPRYTQIIDEVETYRFKHNLKAGAEAEESIALFVIDAQVGFCTPGASLFVPGAVGDITRLCKFIYNNVKHITKLYFSLDLHNVFQIFYSSFWVDAAGNNPQPLTVITAADVMGGRWRPICEEELAFKYISELEKNSKYNLVIWPYHTMQGSIDNALVPMLFETAFFYSIVKKANPCFITKGEYPLTENYSVFCPEVQTLKVGDRELNTGCFNKALFTKIMSHDRIYIAGEASSHCVKATVEDIIQQLEAVDSELIKKIYILEDCMSPVPAIPEGIDFPELAQKAMKQFAAKGVNIVKSDRSLIAK